MAHLNRSDVIRHLGVESWEADVAAWGHGRAVPGNQAEQSVVTILRDDSVQPQGLVRAVSPDDRPGVEELTVLLVEVDPFLELSQLVVIDGSDVPLDAKVSKDGGRRTEGQVMGTTGAVGGG